MAWAADRFETGADRYDRVRPAYPEALLDHLKAALKTAPSGPIVDVGAGTGIFTRQLAERLPGAQIIGLEPSQAMRERARAVSPDLTFLDGAAESLPFEDGQARAVTAATAAHWFDRPAFYAEAWRVLAPGGVLALLDYPRDEAGNRAAREAEAFLRGHGGPRLRETPDYEAELSDLAGFHEVKAWVLPIVVPLTPEVFVERILSSSYARSVERALGLTETREAIADLARSLTDEQGRVPLGHRFRLATARRAG